MKRSVILVVGVASLVGAVAFVSVEVRREREFRRLIAVGDAAAATDGTSEAIEAFSGALVFKPDAMLAHLKRGETYLRRGELAAALRDLGEASRLDPTAPLPLERLGDVNTAMGRYAEASRHYERYLSLDDRAPRVLYKLGLARYRSGDASLALEPLQQSLAIDERVAETHYVAGLARRAAGRDEDAVPALRRSLELHAGFSEAREELARLYADLGRRRESLEQLEALAALDPTRAEWLVSVALVYARLGRLDPALSALGRAAERDPDSAIVRTALGRVWLDASADGADPAAVRKALAALRPIAERADATGEALALYGKALLLSGDVAGAERRLQQAVERLPVEPAAFGDLADAAARLGHTAIARDAAAKHAVLTSR